MGREREMIVLRRNHNVGDAFELVASAYGQALARHCSAIRRRSDPETIHRMRIAIRRLLTAMSALTTRADDPACAAIKLKLHRLQKALNGPRDADTWLETLPESAQSLTAEESASLRNAVIELRARELAKCQQLCRSHEYQAISREIGAWVRSGTWRGNFSLMPITLRSGQYLAKLDHKIRKRTKSISKLDQAATHKLRIRVKKARYATELFAPLFKKGSAKKLKRHSEALERLQNALGALTDLASHQRIAKMLAHDETSQNPALSLFAGIVLGQELGARTKLMKAAGKACKHYRKMPPPVTWTGPRRT